MGEKEQIDELDRNMDTVFDNLLAVNTFITALAQSLDPKTAAAVVERMDKELDQIATLVNPPGLMGRNLLFGWRNLPAQQAGLPIRPLV